MEKKNQPEVLIVEDDRNTRQLFADVAESLGWRVQLADDGENGWELYEQKTPDLIISDIMMPRLDGLGLLRRVRGKDLLTPFIVVTALRGEDSPIEALKYGANDFILKPLKSIKELRILLNRHEGRIVHRKAKEEIFDYVQEEHVRYSIPNDLALVPPLCDALTAHISNTDIRFAVKLGLMELITNAIEHGNLEISTEEKRHAMEQTGATWKELLDGRRNNPLMGGRHVVVTSHRNMIASEWIVQDEGKGFEPDFLAEPSESLRTEKLTGRGIFLARQQFDEFEYLESGRAVRVKKRRNW